MKIILDECLPKKLKNCFPSHEVKTVPEAGWAGKKNGELLSLVQSQFDIFITVDRNLSFQQNLETIEIRVIVIASNSNRFQDIQELVPAILNEINKDSSPGVVTIQS